LYNFEGGGEVSNLKFDLESKFVSQIESIEFLKTRIAYSSSILQEFFKAL